MDTGPLVAFLDRTEVHHNWSVEQFRQFAVPLLTCEPVLTECLFLLRNAPVAQDKLLEFVERGILVVELRVQEKAATLRKLMDKYRSAPMSLADACLVCMAETTELPVCTLDSHFGLYRRHGRTALQVISPQAG